MKTSNRSTIMQTVIAALAGAAASNPNVMEFKDTGGPYPVLPTFTPHSGPWVNPRKANQRKMRKRWAQTRGHRSRP